MAIDSRADRGSSRRIITPQTSRTGKVMYAYLVVSYGSNSSAKSSSPESRREVTSSVLPE